MLPVKCESPEYTAVMEWEAATVKAEVASVALPPLTVPVPSTTAPFLKVTVPVGVPVPECVMVAVNVTDWPNSEGFKDEANVVVLEFSTTSVSEPELVLKYVAPLYVAVME